MRIPACLIALLLLATPAAAQAPCNGGQGDFQCWATWSSDNLWRNHPVAHGLGGMASQLVARGPWFSEGVRRSLWGRLAVTAAVTAFWELELKKEMPRYQWSYMAYDLGAAVTGALLVEAVLALGRKR